MLSAMQQAAENSPSPGSSSFAGLLASLAAPAAPVSGLATDRTDIDLGEDVVTLSYERALRSRARYRATNLTVWEAESAPAAPGLLIADANAGQMNYENVGRPVDADKRLGELTHTAEQAAARHESRSASVSIRLSKQECARLRQRAEEAGLTVSAYLRSCALEADSLRAQVKATLAELRTTGSNGKPAATNPGPRPWFAWITRALPRNQNSQTSRHS
jgi:predicted DNA binding CopG/RHH family protein